MVEFDDISCHLWKNIDFPLAEPRMYERNCCPLELRFNFNRKINKINPTMRPIDVSQINKQITYYSFKKE